MFHAPCVKICALSGSQVVIAISGVRIYWENGYNVAMRNKPLTEQEKRMYEATGHIAFDGLGPMFLVVFLALPLLMTMASKIIDVQLPTAQAGTTATSYIR
jgi:hypothetical protein